MRTSNGIELNVVKTWLFEAEFPGDPREGMSCVRLESDDGRYSLITDATTLASLEN